MPSDAINIENQQVFWESNKASYQGLENARWLTLLVRPQIGRRILDAGAGDGSLIRCLQQSMGKAEIRGVDLAPKADFVEQGDLRNLQFPTAYFDTVFCSEVIEHLTREDTLLVLKELQRVLMPGGNLILTTPFDEELEDSTVCCPHCHHDFHRWGHQQRFLEADFAALAQEVNMTPQDIFAVRYNRIRQFGFLGRKFCLSPWMRKSMRNARGKRHLVMVARRQQADAPTGRRAA